MTSRSSEPEVVFRGDAFAAREVWSRLRGHGLDAHVLGESFSTLLFGGAHPSVEVVVPAGQAQDARAVLAEPDEEEP